MQLSFVSSRCLPFGLALLGSLATARAQVCSGPGASCPSGQSPSTSAQTDAFGPHTSQWHSEAPSPNAPRLHVPKFVPAPGQTLIQVEVRARADASGAMGVENRDPLNQCVNLISLDIALELEAVSPPIPSLGTVQLALTQGFPVTLAPFDGTDDRMGASGATIDLSGVTDSACTRLIDPAVLALFTDTNPGDGITEMIEFRHQANDGSSSSPCAPQTFVSDPLARLQVDVIYTVCSISITDCDHDGIPDDRDPDTSTCACRPVNRRTCGSLLLYPELDNRPGCLTLATITNGCCEDVTSNVQVEFRFINRSTCLKTDTTFTLTPCDTLTFITSAVNPNTIQGYFYAYAKNPAPGSGANPTGTPIVFNHLIGQELLIDGISTLSYSMNAVSFRGLGRDRAANDDDDDGIRDLNGPGAATPEYEEAPDQIIIPRFFGQDSPRRGVYNSQLILLNLSGGSRFTTIVDALIFNDNEEATSQQYEFYCWDKVNLRDFSGATLESTLDGLLSDDPDEILGHNSRNAGWISLNGNVANSNGPESILDPAIYAVLVERTGVYAASDLPWEYCTQNNGDLLPVNIFGDGPNPVAGDNQ